MSGAAAAVLLGGVAPLVITTATLPTPTYNVAYNQTVSATGGVTPYTWSISAGALPAGLSINSSSGAITGTPTAPGAYSFTVKVTDAISETATQTYSGTIADPAMSITTSSPLPAGSTGTSYSTTLAATGGAGAYTWSLFSGSLPAGLSISSAGVISGTPTAPGNPSFTIKVQDAFSQSATKTFTLNVTFTPVTNTYTTSGTETPPVGWSNLTITADGPGGVKGSNLGLHVGGPGGGGSEGIEVETNSGQTFTHTLTSGSTTVTSTLGLNLVAIGGGTGGPASSGADGAPGAGGTCSGANTANTSGSAGVGHTGGTAASGATAGTSPGGGQSSPIGAVGGGQVQYAYT